MLRGKVKNSNNRKKLCELKQTKKESFSDFRKHKFHKISSEKKSWHKSQKPWWHNGKIKKQKQKKNNFWDKKNYKKSLIVALIEKNTWSMRKLKTYK